MSKQIVTLFARKEGMDLVKRHCREVQLPVGDLQRMLEEIIEKDPLQRRHGLWQAFDEILDASSIPDDETSRQA